MHLSYSIVGSGYRAKFYARIAAAYSSLFSAMFLCRSEEKAALMTRETGIAAVWSIEEGEAFKPDFVVIAVNKTSITDVCAEWVERGYPVLMETPGSEFSWRRRSPIHGKKFTRSQCPEGKRKV